MPTTNAIKPSGPSIVRAVSVGFTDEGALLMRVPSYGNALSEVRGWPRTITPNKGDEALLGYDDRGSPWVISWARRGNDVTEYGADRFGGSDASEAIQRCIDANVGGKVYLPTGLYRLSKALVLPSFTTLEGEDMYATVLLAEGNFYCIGLGRSKAEGAAAITVSTLKLEAASKQSAGGGIGWNFVSAEIHIDHLCLGNCLFRGIDIANPEGIGAVFLNHIRWNGVTTAVRECTTAIRIGDSVGLVVGVYGHDITGAANSHGDMGKWLEINYSDTIQFTDCLFQTGTIGVTTQPLGHPPEAIFRAVTGLRLTRVTCDDFSGNGFIIKQVRDCELNDCAAQGCFFGTLVTDQSLGVRIRGGCMQINKYHGIVLDVGCEYVSIAGVDIADNGTIVNPGIAGVSVAPGVSHWSVVDNTIGNFYGLFSNVTHFGVVVEIGSSDDYVVEGNTFVGPQATHPLTEDVADGGSGTNKRIANNKKA